jgi:RHS repeat-associated protein
MHGVFGHRISPSFLCRNIGRRRNARRAILQFESLETRRLKAEFSLFASAASAGQGLGALTISETQSINAKYDITGVPFGLKTPIPISVQISVTAEAQANSLLNHILSVGVGQVSASVSGPGFQYSGNFTEISQSGAHTLLGSNPTGTYSFTVLVTGPTTIPVNASLTASAGSSISAASGGTADARIAMYATITVPSSSGAQITQQTPPPSADPPTKANGPESDTPGNIHVGDPMDVNTGNVYRSVQDFSTAGINPLEFTRYYNTFVAPNNAAVTLGGRWRSTYDRYLHFVSPALITAERQTGQTLTFTLLDGVWKADSDLDYTLSQTGPNWLLIGPDDTVESYSDSGTGLGIPASIRARDGYTQVLQYGTGGQLSTVTDSFGRSLSFRYQNGLLHTVTAPDAQAFTYGYTAPNGKPALAQVAYPTTPTTSLSYTYYATGLLKDALDQNGHAIASFSYDAGNRATQVYAGGDAAVGLVKVSYNDTDGSRTVTDANNLHTLYKFTVLQGVPKAVEVARSSEAGRWTSSTSTYDANGYVTSSTDWNDNRTLFVNNAHGQPLSITEAADTALARTTTISYHPVFRLPVQIVAPGLTTDLTYDASGNLVARTEIDTTAQVVPYPTNGQQRHWTYTYDGLGHVLTANGPRTDVSDVTKYTYDTAGNPISVTDALGHVTRFASYNGRGLPLSVTDANGVVTQFVYDVLGRLLSSTVLTAAGNAATRNAYDPAGLLISVTQPDNLVLFYAYDTAQRLTKVSNPAGESITYTLDGMGNAVRQDIRNAGGTIVHTQSRVFNPLNQLVQSVGGIASEITTYTHDANGNVTSVTDALHHTTYQAFDALDRLVQSTDPLGGITRYGYDAQGNTISVTTPRGLTTNYVYDGFGEVIQVSSPDTGTTTYHYDPAGNVVAQMDARGVVTNRTFDALGRLLTETYPTAPAENITYSYDSTAGGNKGIGHLTGYTDGSGATTLKYDDLGGITNETKIAGGVTASTSYKYNLAGKVTQVTYPSGLLANYSYDGQGRVNGVSVANYSTVPAPAVTVASNVTYMPFGPVSSFAYGNRLVMSRSFDLDYRITTISVNAGATTVQSLGFGYDPTGNITAVTDNLATGNNQTFTYDELNRILTATGAYQSIGYSYDADSNRLTSTQGGVTQVYSYSPTSNRLLSVTGDSGTRSFTYTAGGNIATDSGQRATYTYSNRNRLEQAAIAGGSTASYLYDASGKRLSTTSGGTVTRFGYDLGGHLITESNGVSGQLSRAYVWLGDLPVAQVEKTGAVYYIHTDQQGTPQKLTNASKAVVWARSQQPFGETASITGTASNNLRFPGQFADSPTGLNYNLNRDYDPSLGRYIEADPIGLAGGINQYGYVGQNPVNASDPLGLCADADGDGWASFADWLRSALSSVGQFTDWIGSNVTPFGMASIVPTMMGLGALRTISGAGIRAFITDESGGGFVSSNSLTQSEQSAINRVINTMRDHLSDSDLTGAISDMVGNPVPKRGGGYYDHAREVNQALNGLRNQIRRLEGSASPQAQAARQAAIEALRRVEDATNGLGI